ncbi:MAG: hypothetical protein R3261_05315 [Alphaproteobacteria bacterium]|nr:hypothetical protein [Alphaproteobacteria bacterium]
MKYLVFNVTVAAVLGYLVFGEDLGLKQSSENAVAAFEEEIQATALADQPEENILSEEEAAPLTIDQIKPLIEDALAESKANEDKPLGEAEIRMIIADAISDALQNQSMADNFKISEAPSVEPSKIQKNAENQLASNTIGDNSVEVEEVPTLVTKAPPVATGGLEEPLAVKNDSDLAEIDVPSVENSSNPAIQIAEGETMMTPETRHRELDKLASSLELLYLDLAQ